MTKRILIVSPEELLPKAKSHLDEVGCDGWSASVDFVCIENKKLARIKQQQQVNRNYEAVIKYLDERDYSAVVFLNSSVDDRSLIQNDYPEVKTYFWRALHIFKREINSLLKELGLHWLPFAHEQWSKAEIGHATPEMWMQQFAELGNFDVARKLLKKLRVVSNAELRASFILSEADIIGHRVAHAFVKDEEQGSSSINVKSILGKIHTNKILELDLGEKSAWEHIDADVLYIYEDGLWSGVEVVNRMEAMWNNESFQSSNLTVHLRYCITCDMGLAAARLFARSKNTSRFQIQAGIDGNHFKFFEVQADLSMTKMMCPNPNDTRKALDDLIDPYAFQRSGPNDADNRDAIRFCEEIGGQLVRHFFERENIKAVATGKAAKQIDDDRVKKWSLGAMRFASTIVFSSSVPKPVIPLFWLKGDVEINGKTIDWIPLFWDARRVGENAPKLRGSVSRLVA